MCYVIKMYFQNIGYCLEFARLDPLGSITCTLKEIVNMVCNITLHFALCIIT